MHIKDNLYGTHEFPDKFAQIIDSPPIQRLKRIHQNGAAFLVNPKITTSRFDHSIGAMIIVKILGGTENAMLAALIHDASHTAFSHVSDSLMPENKISYHEHIREIFLENSGLLNIIHESGYDARIVSDPENHPILDCPYPDLCADRLDYFFRDLYASRIIGQNDIQKALENLVFSKSENIVMCKNKETARFIFRNFIRLNQEIFFDSGCEAADALIGYIVSRMLSEKKLTECDLMEDDNHVIEIIKKSSYSDMLSLTGPEMIIKTPSSSDSTGGQIFTRRRKLRFVDPKVVGTNKRITELDTSCASVFKKYLKTKTELLYMIHGI